MIYFSQSQLLLVKTNEDRTTSRKALFVLGIPADWLVRQQGDGAVAVVDGEDYLRQVGMAQGGGGVGLQPHHRHLAWNNYISIKPFDM